MKSCCKASPIKSQRPMYKPTAIQPETVSTTTTGTNTLTATTTKLLSCGVNTEATPVRSTTATQASEPSVQEEVTDPVPTQAQAQISREQTQTKIVRKETASVSQRNPSQKPLPVARRPPATWGTEESVGQRDHLLSNLERSTHREPTPTDQSEMVADTPVVFDVSVGVNPETNQLQIIDAEDTDAALSKMKSAQSSAHFNQPFHFHALKDEADKRLLHSPSPARTNPTNFKPSLREIKQVEVTPLQERMQELFYQQPTVVGDTMPKPFAFQRGGNVDESSFSPISHSPPPPSALQLYTHHQDVIQRIDAAAARGEEESNVNGKPLDRQRYVQIPNMAVRSQFDRQGAYQWQSSDKVMARLTKEQDEEASIGVDEEFVNQYRQWSANLQPRPANDFVEASTRTAQTLSTVNNVSGRQGRGVGGVDISKLSGPASNHSTVSSSSSQYITQKEYVLDEASARRMHTQRDPQTMNPSGVPYTPIRMAPPPPSAVPHVGSPSLFHTSWPSPTDTSQSAPIQRSAPVVGATKYRSSVNAVNSTTVIEMVEELPSPSRRVRHLTSATNNVVDARAARNTKQEQYYRDQQQQHYQRNGDAANQSSMFGGNSNSSLFSTRGEGDISLHTTSGATKLNDRYGGGIPLSAASRSRRGPEPVGSRPESIVHDTMWSLNHSDHSGALSLAKNIGESCLFKGAAVNPFVLGNVSSNTTSVRDEQESFLIASPPRVRPLRVFDEETEELREERAAVPNSPYGSIRLAKATTFNAMSYNPSYRCPVALDDMSKVSKVSTPTPLYRTPTVAPHDGSQFCGASPTNLSGVIRHSHVASPATWSHHDILGRLSTTTPQQR